MEVIFVFQYNCIDCDGNSLYVYGCIYFVVENYNVIVDIDNGKCVFILLLGWALFYWGFQKNQVFVLFYKLCVDGKLFEFKDVVGVFLGEKGMGFGFIYNDFIMVFIVGVQLGDEISFMCFDYSMGVVNVVMLDMFMVWQFNKICVVGCMDKIVVNYFKYVMVLVDVCE